MKSYFPNPDQRDHPILDSNTPMMSILTRTLKGDLLFGSAQASGKGPIDPSIGHLGLPALGP